MDKLHNNEEAVGKVIQETNVPREELLLLKYGFLIIVMKKQKLLLKNH